MDYSILFVIAAIVGFSAVALILAFLNKKGRNNLDVERYRVKYLAIEQQLTRDNPSSHHLAVLNADKLVDQALKDRGINGETMGERMKNSVKLFSDINGVWSAHKLRNKIAHETDAVVNYEEAKYALVNFKRALKDLGAI